MRKKKCSPPKRQKYAASLLICLVQVIKLLARFCTVQPLVLQTTYCILQLNCGLTLLILANYSLTSIFNVLCPSNFDVVMPPVLAKINTLAIVTLPSVLLCIAEIVTVVRHKQFHNSFYALFVVRALADLLHTINSYFGFKLPVAFGASFYGIYAQLPNWVLRLSILLGIYSFQAINFATVFVSVSRLSAVAVPILHETLWNTVLFRVAILVIFVLPLVPLLFIFQIAATLVPSPEASSSSFRLGESVETNFAPLVSDICSAVAIFSLIICLMLNFGTWVAYKWRRRWGRKTNGPNELGGQNQRTERKLCIYTLCTFVSHMIISALMIGMALSARLGFSTAVQSLYAQYTCAIDWCTVVVTSWLLLWASSSFRQQMVNDLAPKWANNWWYIKWADICTGDADERQNGATNRGMLIAKWHEMGRGINSDFLLN